MTMKLKLPELLAPAGNMERLKAALRFGADAVYIGLTAMSLRNYAENFDERELKNACSYAHAQGKRVYVALNAFARDCDIEKVPELIELALCCGADALIVNDPGIIRVCRRAAPDMPLHLSTQANTLNSEAALFWHEQGISRIILARELSIAQTAKMREKLPKTLELEAFVHGAMCVSYSGRCLLSNYIAGRDCNRGECVQPCRWTYELREAGSDGLYFPIEQDERGTYILNSRDMCLINRLPELINAGIMSLKIEGRMKSVYYVAATVNAYRMALNEYASCVERGESFVPSAQILAELDSVSHRPYSEGFAMGATENAQYTKSASYIGDADIAATVISYDEKNCRAYLQQRNKFGLGDALSILSPGDIGRSFIVNDILGEFGNVLSSVPHPKERVFVTCSEPLKAGDILRKSKEI